MKKMIVAAMGVLWAVSLFAQAAVVDNCTIGYCGVNTSSAGLWVQLTGQGGQIPPNTWATSGAYDANTINRMLATLLMAKSMGSNQLVWVQGNLMSGILYLDTVVLP